MCTGIHATSAGGREGDANVHGGYTESVRTCVCVPMVRAGFGECSKAYVFRGVKEVTSQQVQAQLGIAGARDPRGANGAQRFLLPAGQGEFAFNNVIEDLRKDAWPVNSDSR
eukprot:GHVU01052548.1.p1 GENE.GHVU01052548.1~~GHVU01052548.1.p1  ORF type:complete len:112 (+),score=12.56 GHVU01052548.1:1085-1420(+)